MSHQYCISLSSIFTIFAFGTFVQFLFFTVVLNFINGAYCNFLDIHTTATTKTSQTKPSSVDDPGTRHGFRGDTSLPLFQDAFANELLSQILLLF